MKLIGYLRVSTQGQVTDGLGLPVQEKMIRAWAKAAGHKLVRIESDNGKSGALPETERPGLISALKAVASGEADGIVVSSIDRLARMLTVQEAILAKVWHLGGRAFTADGGEITADDPDDPMRTAMRQMAGVFAQLDRAMLVKRLRNGRAEKAAQGGYAYGGPPYGWSAVDGSLVPESAEQEVLTVMRELRAAGLSYGAVAAELNVRGTPARRGRWHAQTVSRALARDPAPQPAETAR